MITPTCPAEAVTEPSPGLHVPKPWGFELIWAHTAYYAAKILWIKPGCRLSLQLHQQKVETITLLSGAMEVDLEAEDGTTGRWHMSPGDVLHIPAGRRHRFCALIPCTVLEVSTPELDDIVRFEDDYERACSGEAG